jgi:hypothetical protein
MDYEEAVKNNMVTPLKYLMLPSTYCPNIAKNPTLPDVALKRWSYWTNAGRNGMLKKFVYDLKKVYDGQILIIVNTAEHAIHLHRMLPWFVVAISDGVDLADLRKKFPSEKFPGLDLEKYKITKKEVDRIRGAFAKGTLRYVISTKIFRQGVDFKHLTVLVRADGDVSNIEGIQVPGRLSRLDKDKKWAYLVDFDDSFSSWSQSRALKRKELYEANKWIQTTYEEVLNELGSAKGDDAEPAIGSGADQLPF